MQSVENNTLAKPPYLLITGEGVEPTTMPLEENNSLFVGSGSNCRIMLRGNEIDPIHCMFWIDENCVLRIQDWNTDGRTVVNGQAVTTEKILNSGDKVEICGHLIVPVLSHEDHLRVANISEVATIQAVDDDPKSDRQTFAEESAAASSCATDESASKNEIPSASIETNAIEASSADLAGSEYVNAPAAEIDMSPGWDEELSNGFGIDADGFNDPPGLGHLQPVNDERDEEIELLKMEVEQLRFELAQQDAYPQHEDVATGDIETNLEADPDPIEDDHTVQLVNRLEDLLEELQTSDERVRGLEELLHYSDQAQQAEQEERQQLESWVAEIEQRVSQREDEFEAEMSRVLKRLEDAQTQYRHVETQLKQVLHSKGTNRAGDSNELIEKTRNQIHDLQQQLKSANQENDRLRQQSSCEGEDKSREELLQMEQKLLDVQVETSRERAEMARQRAKLKILKDEFEQKLGAANGVGSADSRVEAMRQHLRDIHEEEKSARKEKRQRSLSGRISRLLNRVGR